MQKLDTKEAIYEKLISREIVFTLDKNKPTYFVLVDDDRVRVYNEQVNYYITLQQFIKSYFTSTFYLYEKMQEEFVSEAKDEEYYSWRHK